MTPTEELNQLIDSLPSRGVTITKKSSSTFHKMIGAILNVLSFGKLNDYMTGYVTTIGKTIAVPDEWVDYTDLAKLDILTHELTHVAQYKKYWILMSIAYLLVFFPIGLAYFRYLFEREAYANGFKKYLEYDPTQRDSLIQHGVDQMTGPNYLWAWPFKSSVLAWFKKNV